MCFSSLCVPVHCSCGVLWGTWLLFEDVFCCWMCWLSWLHNADNCRASTSDPGVVPHPQAHPTKPNTGGIQPLSASFLSLHVFGMN